MNIDQCISRTNCPKRCRKSYVDIKSNAEFEIRLIPFTFQINSEMQTSVHKVLCAQGQGQNKSQGQSQGQNQT